MLNRYARQKGILKEKDDNLIGEDVREGLVAIVSVKLKDPQFEGQTKTKLGNTEMRSFVETSMNAKLSEWLEEHPGDAQADRAEVPKRRRRRASPPSRPATWPGASPCSRAGRCPASSPTAS